MSDGKDSNLVSKRGGLIDLAVNSGLSKHDDSYLFGRFSDSVPANFLDDSHLHSILNASVPKYDPIDSKQDIKLAIESLLNEFEGEVTKAIDQTSKKGEVIQEELDNEKLAADAAKLALREQERIAAAKNQEEPDEDKNPIDVNSRVKKFEKINESKPIEAIKPSLNTAILITESVPKNLFGDLSLEDFSKLMSLGDNEFKVEMQNRENDRLKREFESKNAEIEKDSIFSKVTKEIVSVNKSEPGKLPKYQAFLGDKPVETSRTIQVKARNEQLFQDFEAGTIDKENNLPAPDIITPKAIRSKPKKVEPKLESFYDNTILPTENPHAVVLIKIDQLAEECIKLDNNEKSLPLKPLTEEISGLINDNKASWGSEQFDEIKSAIGEMSGQVEKAANTIESYNAAQGLLVFGKSIIKELDSIQIALAKNSATAADAANPQAQNATDQQQQNPAKVDKNKSPIDENLDGNAPAPQNPTPPAPSANNPTQAAAAPSAQPVLQPADPGLILQQPAQLPPLSSATKGYLDGDIQSIKDLRKSFGLAKEFFINELINTNNNVLYTANQLIKEGRVDLIDEMIKAFDEMLVSISANPNSTYATHLRDISDITKFHLKQAHILDKNRPILDQIRLLSLIDAKDLITQEIHFNDYPSFCKLDLSDKVKFLECCNLYYTQQGLPQPNNPAISGAPHKGAPFTDPDNGSKRPVPMTQKQADKMKDLNTKVAEDISTARTPAEKDALYKQLKEDIWDLGRKEINEWDRSKGEFKSDAFLSSLYKTNHDILTLKLDQEEKEQISTGILDSIVVELGKAERKFGPNSEIILYQRNFALVLQYQFNRDNPITLCKVNAPDLTEFNNLPYDEKQEKFETAIEYQVMVHVVESLVKDCKENEKFDSEKLKNDIIAPIYGHIKSYPDLYLREDLKEHLYKGVQDLGQEIAAKKNTGFDKDALDILEKFVADVGQLEQDFGQQQQENVNAKYDLLLQDLTNINGRFESDGAYSPFNSIEELKRIIHLMEDDVKFINEHSKIGESDAVCVALKSLLDKSYTRYQQLNVNPQEKYFGEFQAVTDLDFFAEDALNILGVVHKASPVPSVLGNADRDPALVHQQVRAEIKAITEAFDGGEQYCGSDSKDALQRRLDVIVNDIAFISEKRVIDANDDVYIALKTLTKLVDIKISGAVYKYPEEQDVAYALSNFAYNELDKLEALNKANNKPVDSSTPQSTLVSPPSKQARKSPATPVYRSNSKTIKVAKKTKAKNPDSNKKVNVQSSSKKGSSAKKKDVDNKAELNASFLARIEFVTKIFERTDSVDRANIFNKILVENLAELNKILIYNKAKKVLSPKQTKFINNHLNAMYKAFNSNYIKHISKDDALNLIESIDKLYNNSGLGQKKPQGFRGHRDLLKGIDGTISFDSTISFINAIKADVIAGNKYCGYGSIGELLNDVYNANHNIIYYKKGGAKTDKIDEALKDLYSGTKVVKSQDPEVQFTAKILEKFTELTRKELKEGKPKSFYHYDYFLSPDGFAELEEAKKIDIFKNLWPKDEQELLVHEISRKIVRLNNILDIPDHGLPQNKPENAVYSARQAAAESLLEELKKDVDSKNLDEAAKKAVGHTLDALSDGVVKNNANLKAEGLLPSIAAVYDSMAYNKPDNLKREIEKSNGADEQKAAAKEQANAEKAPQPPQPEAAPEVPAEIVRPQEPEPQAQDPTSPGVPVGTEINSIPKAVVSPAQPLYHQAELAQGVSEQASGYYSGVSSYSRSETEAVTDGSAQYSEVKERVSEALSEARDRRSVERRDPVEEAKKIADEKAAPVIHNEKIVHAVKRLEEAIVSSEVNPEVQRALINEISIRAKHAKSECILVSEKSNGDGTKLMEYKSPYEAEKRVRYLVNESSNEIVAVEFDPGLRGFAPVLPKDGKNGAIIKSDGVNISKTDPDNRVKRAIVAARAQEKPQLQQRGFAERVATSRANRQLQI